MQTTDTIPLFRTVAALPVLAEPAAAATEQPSPAQPAEMDITDCVGATVDPATWVWLQAEVQRRYGGSWTLYAKAVDRGYRITGLKAQRAKV